MEYKDVQLSFVERLFRSIVQRYNGEKYWKYRAIVVDPRKGSKLGDLYRLWYIKRADAFNNATMGTHRNYGASFDTPPQLPHGLNGIVISHNAKVGRNCRIYHQVTIGEGAGGAPAIGDDVLIGAGAKLVGGIRVGNRVKIAPGCVVMGDVPDGATVLPPAPQIVLHERENRCEEKSLHSHGHL